jgi:flagellar M-ring protein FliF
MDAAALRDRVTGALKSFSPGQLAVMGMLGLAVLVGGMTFMRWASAPSYSVLFSGLEPKDASEVVDKLKSQGVPYKLVSDGSAIMVPQSKVYDLRLSMSAEGLPKGSVVGYEILNNQGLTTSEFSQQVNYQRAVEGELTRTLMAMRGIDSASIHLAIPKDDLFTDNNEEPSAAVLVKTSGTLGDDAVDSIVHLVASSVPGMKPDAVTVADTNGSVLSNATGTAGGSNRELKLTQAYQNNLATSANAMLAQVFGAGHAIVRVSATLNYDEKSTTTDTYDKASQVAVHEENSSETFKGTDNSAGTTAGTTGATGTSTNATTTGNGTDYQKADSTKDYGVNHTVENAKVAPGKLERLSVAVMIDKAVKPAPSTTQIEDLVGAALGIDKTRGDQIVVDTLSFEKDAAAAASAAAKPAAGASPMMDYAQTGVGVLILGFVAFFLLKGMRKTKIEVLDIPSPQFALAANSGTSPFALGSGSDGNGTALMPANGSTQEQVLTLVDQQPDEVAVLLRSWLGDRR